MEKRHRRPLGVTLLAAGVLLLGAGYLLPSGQALSRLGLYEQYPLSVPAWYPALAGAVWGGLCLALGAGLWLERTLARRAALAAVPLLLAAWVADALLFGRNGIAIQSFGFDLTVRLILAAAAEAVLLGAERGARSAGAETGTGERRHP
jgi:hypothetical protein